MSIEIPNKRKIVNFICLAMVCFATIRLSLLNISVSGSESRSHKVYNLRGMFESIAPFFGVRAVTADNVHATKTYTAIDFGKHMSKHPGVLNVSRWLSALSENITMVESDYLVNTTNGSKQITTDLIFYEAEADTGRIRDDIRTIIARKRPDAVAVIIYTSAYQYVPSVCPDNTTLFYVINTNKNSNCIQTQITHYPKLARLSPEYIEAWRINSPSKQILHWDIQRPLLAGFIGSSWTYPYRQYMINLNKYHDVNVRFNEDFWKKYTNITYLQQVQTEHYDVLSKSTFSLCPRGVGVSSIRFIESVIFGSIPVLMDDNLQPFGHHLDFAVRYTFSPQNTSLPATNTTMRSLENLYRTLQKISRNETELTRRRQGMLDFFYTTLAPDLQHPQWAATYPHLPFASTIMKDVERVMQSLKQR
ncbi:hypothetical protein EON65_12615 [archaeon]|nr:MAG: hypothetical protein EON65_12615 [archaeon]